MKPQIEVKLLKGFRDFLPENEMIRKTIIRKLETTYEQFGFVPIDTPAIEYAGILLGKSGGETEKQVYTFMDQGEREVALRFDLTVPFARYLAMHRQELVFPFKRYHIAKVWRGEKPHAGRYREFMQCDFDIVGTDTASADFEIMLVMYRSLKSLRIDQFKIHFSHRALLTDFLASLGVSGKAADIMRVVDKSKKIGLENTASELKELIDKRQIGQIIDFITPFASTEAMFEKIETLFGKDNPHLERLKTIYSYIQELGLGSYYVFDASITRGLDYYTGVVFETFLSGCEDMGSVCSGGRYDNLVALYSPENLSGVGASVGLDRLIAVLEKRGQLPSGKDRTLLAIPVIEEELSGYYHKLAEIFRSENINVEVFHEKKKLASQFTIAEKKGIRFALLAGGIEREKNVVHIRDLRERKNIENLSISEAIVKIRELIAANHFSR
jgi:histidyl-tRNA synthetase